MNPARTSIAATAFACAALFSVTGAQAAADHAHAMKHVAAHHHHHMRGPVAAGADLAAGAVDTAGAVATGVIGTAGAIAAARPVAHRAGTGCRRLEARQIRVRPYAGEIRDRYEAFARLLRESR